MNSLRPAILDESISHPSQLRGRGLWQWLDFTDISTLYVEEDFTVPVAANLDEIGAALDKSGQGRHITQGTSTARALYLTNQVNGLSAAGFGSAGSGAVDDYYDISNPGILNANWTIVVNSVVNSAAVKGLYGAAANGWREFWDASEVYTGGKAAVANVYASSAGQTAATWMVTLAIYGANARAIIELGAVDRSPTANSVTDQTMTVNTALFGALTGPASFGDYTIAEVIKGASQGVTYDQLKGFARRYLRPKYGLAV